MSESQISAVIAAAHSSLKVNKVRASLVAQMVKNPPVMQETRFDPWVRKIPWRRE